MMYHDDDAGVIVAYELDDEYPITIVYGTVTVIANNEDELSKIIEVITD